jgi:hypothetical protein
MNQLPSPSATLASIRDAVSSFASDLREKRLWPVVAALVVALIAVPLVLSKSSSPAPAPTTVAQGAGAAAPSTEPAVSVSAAPSQVSLNGRARDPFTQQKTASPAKPTAATAGTGSGASSTAAATGAGTASTGTSSSSTGSAVPTSGPAPRTVIPTGKPKPVVTGLSANQAYHVAVTITNGSGGLNAIDPLQRLSILPSEQSPMLVNLGVLQGGRRVLFVVEPGTVLGGPGICTPGPIDCQIVSLVAGQVESLSRRTSSGSVWVSDFAITGISVDRFPSAAAASRARNATAAAGRRLLDGATGSALSLFQFQPNLGAIVDQRDLTVGGN